MLFEMAVVGMSSVQESTKSIVNVVNITLTAAHIISD